MEDRAPIAVRIYEWIGRIILALISGAFGVWALKCSYERLEGLLAHPDAIGDGRFTLSDVPLALFQVITEVGVRYQVIIAHSRFGSFLEISADDPSLLWTIVLTIFSFWFGIGGPWMFLFGTNTPRNRARRR